MTELELGSAYQQGRDMKSTIQATIVENGGVFSMPASDAGAIAQCVANCKGDYLEIGSLFGGSAIVAALFAKGRVYCIDPFGYAPGQTRTAGTPSAELVAKNAYAFGAMEKLRIFTQKHPPLPPNLEYVRFDIAFIDGDHTYEGVLADWENLKDRVDRYILFHDVENRHFGARKVFSMASKHDDWFPVYRQGKMGIIEHR
jgi:predicted O-methyltransferase YrrM